MFQSIITAILAGLLAQSGLSFLLAPLAEISPTKNNVSIPQRIESNSLGIDTTAQSVLVIDAASGKVLFEKNAQAKRPIASITKLMTALVALDAGLDWDATVLFEKNDQRTGDIDRIIPGETVRIEDLFGLMVVASSNDAASALARIISGNNFVGDMNDKAHALGMMRTIFTDPTGLEPTNVSSASDLVLLAREAFVRDEIKQGAALMEYSFSPLGTSIKRIAPATDQLLGSFLNQAPYEIIGAKTGYTQEAGYCLILMVRRDGHDVVVALLGSVTTNDRWQEAKGLVDWVFINYQWGT